MQECDCLNGQLHFLLLIINHKEDIDVTNKLIEASKLFGIMICDHIIIGKNCYFSFMEKKLINR